MFRHQPIKFVTTTATAIGEMKPPDALKKLSRLRLEDADALPASWRFRVDNGIVCIQFNKRILSIKTRPTYGCKVTDRSEGEGKIR